MITDGEGSLKVECLLSDGHVVKKRSDEDGNSGAQRGARRVRLLVLIVAFNAESTLRGVLARIPTEVFEQYDCEVLVIDDASVDATFEQGNNFARENLQVPIVVLRNPANQGYGGNQKIGYTYAIRREFDMVAMVHGDGQYAPEELPRLLSPVASREADAVFGSRMLAKGGARNGGMPLYKLVGNRILTRFQNQLTGASLSEWHSGYRVYSVAALRRIHFVLNDDGFSFDTEIILQLQHAGAKIVELPIPTYYGDEICYVNGTRYAAEVAAATISSALHKRGLGEQRRFDPVDDGDPPYELKLGYASSHTYAIAAIPQGASVLDLGSGPGGLANELQRKGCHVAVVDAHKPSQIPEGTMVYVQDLNDVPDLPIAEFDVLLVLDVIEHLANPESFLDGLREDFADRPTRLVLSTPNVAFIVQRLMLACGRFSYGREGILDRSHTRLFTFGSLQRLLLDAGFRDLKVRGVPAPFPKALGDTRLARVLLRLNILLIRVRPQLFAYQIFVEARPTPTTSRSLGLALDSQVPVSGAASLS